jgi:hypothetical protein
MAAIDAYQAAVRLGSGPEALAKAHGDMLDALVTACT